jgi:Ni/Co efflux regulator RcnB
MTRLLVAIVAVAVCAGGASAQPHAENGLLAEADRSNRLVDRLYRTIRDWLRVRGFSPAS